MTAQVFRATGSGLRCLLTVWLVGAISAASASTAPTNTVAAPAAPYRSLAVCLRRAISAPQRVNFEGTFVVASQAHGASSHIVHYGDGHTQLERIDRLDGPERVVFRRDDEVLTLWPAAHTLSLESHRLGRRFPLMLHEGIERIAQHYTLLSQGQARVAGRMASVVSLQPKDSYRYGYRLWLDDATGLPLRAEVVDARQQILEWAAFSDITIGVKAEPQRVLQGLKPHDGWTVRQAALEDVDPLAQGWVLRDLPPGFELVRAVRRMPRHPGAAEVSHARDGGGMLQLVFSDGLTYVSLFVEPRDARAPRPNMLVSMGATQTLMMRRDAWWLTAVGDVPPDSLKAFLAALQRRP